jgi:hypothetical protein
MKTSELINELKLSMACFGDREIKCLNYRNLIANAANNTPLKIYKVRVVPVTFGSFRFNCIIAEITRKKTDRIVGKPEIK